MSEYAEHTAHVTDRRSRTLTKHDLADLAKLLQTHTICSLNIDPDVAKALNSMTPEQWGILRRIMIVSGKAANITGAVIIAAIVGGVIAVFTRGIWITIFTGVRKGVGQ